MVGAAPLSLLSKRGTEKADGPSSFMARSKYCDQRGRENIRKHVPPALPGDLSTHPGGGWRGCRTSACPGPTPRLPAPNWSPQHKEGQPGSVTEASVGGKVTAHFSLNAPAWGSHLIARCFKQMAREGTAAPGCFRGAPGEPIQRTSRECPAAWLASAPEAVRVGAWSLGFQERLPKI